MKKGLLFALTILLAVGAFAQQNFRIRINHKLGSNAFAFNASATNNNGIEFAVRRMQYYLSELTLIHDGGQETMVPDRWLLVDAGFPFDSVLGSYNVSSLEGIKFGVGVQQSYNHLDPSSYAMEHPLAPKSPSMHWGWSSGYRFACLEGKSGAGLLQIFEVHALEDSNYFHTTVMTSGIADGNDIVIDLDADIARALENIDVSFGPTNHGGGGISHIMLENFRDYVFSEATLSTSANAQQEYVDFNLYPNPSTGDAQFILDPTKANGAELRVFDATGRMLLQQKIGSSGQGRIEMKTNGLYFVSVLRNGATLVTRNWVVHQ